jgi:hypothetical protein
MTIFDDKVFLLIGVIFIFVVNNKSLIRRNPTVIFYNYLCTKIFPKGIYVYRKSDGSFVSIPKGFYVTNGVFT